VTVKRLQVCTCLRCGFDFMAAGHRRYCAECPTNSKPIPNEAGWLLAAEVTHLRLALQNALGALKLGAPALAVAILEGELGPPARP
jgi:hypothetical protein